MLGVRYYVPLFDGVKGSHECVEAAYIERFQGLAGKRFFERLAGFGVGHVVGDGEIVEVVVENSVAHGVSVLLCAGQRYAFGTDTDARRRGINN